MGRTCTLMSEGKKDVWTFDALAEHPASTVKLCFQWVLCFFLNHQTPLSLIPVSQLLISYPCTVAPSLPSSEWSPSVMRAPSKTPSVAHQFVWGSLLLPEPLLGLTTELQRDLWPVFGFSSNIPSHSGHGVAAVPLPTSGATGLEGRAAQNSLQMEDERAALMDVSGAARPYSSPTDPCRAGCSKCCPAREK